MKSLRQKLKLIMSVIFLIAIEHSVLASEIFNSIVTQ